MAAKLDVPSPAALLETARSEAGALEALLEARDAGQSVHGARRRIKQLRSLLRLLRAPVGKDAYAQVDAALRAAADALAGHRRAEALVAAAAKLEGAQGGAWRHIAGANRAAHAAEGDPQAIVTARFAITRASTLLASAVPDEETGGIARAFIAAYRKARKLLSKGLAAGDPETLHEARKFVIHHLHQLKLLQPGARRLGKLEALREVLGDINDLFELEQLAAGVRMHEDDARRMRKARRRLMNTAGDAARELFRHKPARWRKRMGHAAAAHSPERQVALQGRK